MTDIPKKFNRVFGGFAWPAENPGFVVLVGEELLLNDVKQHSTSPVINRHYHVITEFESHNMDILIRMATVFSSKYKAQSWYGRVHKGQTKPLPAMNYLDTWNQDAYRRRVKAFYIIEAPFIEDQGFIEYHLNILKSLLDPNKKLLTLHNSMIKTHLLNVPIDTHDVRDLQYPSVAALAYAVSAMEVWRPEEDYLEQKEADMILAQLMA